MIGKSLIFGATLGAMTMIAADVSAAVEPLKIVCFGDSTTAGLNMAPYTLLTIDHDAQGPTRWLYTYCDILRDELPGLIGMPIDSINKSISGNMSHQAVDYLSLDPAISISAGSRER